MKNEFVPYAEALALKALGFNDSAFGYYNIDPQLKTPAFNLAKPFEHEWCLPAPLYQQVFRWFREKYNWQHSIDPTADQHSHQLGYNYWIWNSKSGEEHHTMPKNRPSGDWEYETYEEAELECLKKLIEIVKK
jgi:hypothetical protein